LLLSHEESCEEIKIREQKLREIVGVALVELRNPVQPIVGINEIILRLSREQDSGTVTVQTEYLLALEEIARRLERLIQEVLDVLRIESGWLRLIKQDFDIHKAIMRAVEDKKAHSNYQSTATIECQFDNTATINGDLQRVSQVLHELLDNAMKFAPAGKILISSRVQGTELEVTVRDNGTGISDEMSSKLFTRFAKDTGPPLQPGLGLGLYISTNIIEAHGGRCGRRIMKMEKEQRLRSGFHLRLKTPLVFRSFLYLPASSYLSKESFAKENIQSRTPKFMIDEQSNIDSIGGFTLHHRKADDRPSLSHFALMCRSKRE
jgi:K+-sensing histidine kinase KdpD